MMVKEKKKILMVVEAMGGGVFTFIVELANELIEEYDIHIAYAVRQQTPENYKEYFDKRVNLIEVKNFGRAINPLKDLLAFFEIKDIAKKIQPDVIHLHSSKAGVLGRWAFNGRKTPLFYTPHGYSYLMANQSWLKRMIYKGIEAISAKRACTTISCSEGEHKETLKFTKNAVYVDNGINIKELQEMLDSMKCVSEDEFTVFTLGRICYQKNPELFNKIALRVPDVKFVWIGDGELRHELTAPNIEILGWTERKVALQRSLQADVFMLTSLWEGLPMSLLEAMYLKKLCVVSNAIGNRDVIHTGRNGFVCDTLEDFVEVINIAKAAKMEKLIESAYLDVEKRYNTSVMTKRYSDIYKYALNNEQVEIEWMKADMS